MQGDRFELFNQSASAGLPKHNKKQNGKGKLNALETGWKTSLASQDGKLVTLSGEKDVLRK